MLVLCTIQVVMMHFMSKTTVTGKVIGENSSKYAVDFSAETTKLGYEGDYTKIMVDKNECVKVK